MLTSKQRAKLRALANSAEMILQVGKGGISPHLVKQADDALTARELIKGGVLETSPLSAKEAANALTQETNSQVVQVIGMKFILYRRNPDKPIIELSE